MGIGHAYTLIWQAAEWLIQEMTVSREQTHDDMGRLTG